VPRLTMFWKNYSRLCRIRDYLEAVGTDRWAAMVDGSVGSYRGYADGKSALELLLQVPLDKEHFDQLPDELRTAWGESGSSEAASEGAAYGRSFAEVFRETEQQFTRSASRIGRAIEVFMAAEHLPAMPKFLLHWTVIELLLNTRQGNLKATLGHRVACLLQRPDVDTEETIVGCAYDYRSRLVHGGTPFRDIPVLFPPYTRVLAQHCIVRIMTDDDLYRVFSGRESGVRQFLDRLDATG